MNKSRLVLGVFAIGLAVTFYVIALGYPNKAANMPLIYSVVVALLGAAMVGQEVVGTLRHRKVSADGATVSSTEDAAEETLVNGPESRKPWKAMLIFLLAAVYLYSISILGYLAATVGFMVAALAIIGHVSWRFAAIGIVLLVAVVCAVFIGFLGLPVPLLPPLLAL
ncbi:MULTISPECIES: tripartite tricarboxylate transporter TctB family protein [unclassified Halomonas]|uniref:tripartite tricarboxylate transporter TctB family protein n=1 Tax=unclassified Halomonas TaxID=2609666 RepID=UPI0006D95FF7|nr:MULTISPECIES: tripartite tricarboxylate transporter TctB family protein [unclassified Halomonas]KPQ27958.1 MAG: Tripartite tricarboxylate transporter TctB family [Halomonas sp. HL-93]SBR51712.1 Tripartite tricarboxylate transporter TctB family protein [Halomonas sp. HL-93]SNY97480.1 Tripartite tricarboxylate transporter TctB family protein [Halomonas sp. hl-4]